MRYAELFGDEGITIHRSADQKASVSSSTDDGCNSGLGYPPTPPFQRNVGRLVLGCIAEDRWRIKMNAGLVVAREVQERVTSEPRTVLEVGNLRREEGFPFFRLFFEPCANARTPRVLNGKPLK